MNRTFVWCLCVGLFALGMAAGIGPAAQASSVMPMNLQTLADYSGQVIVGKVTAVECSWVDNPRRIESRVTFQQVEYLKGKLPDSRAEFVLTVPGGKVDDKAMHICCAPQFSVGQKWLLMLLPTYKTFPVAGLYQGAFRVVADDKGVERVYVDDHGELLAIDGLDDDRFVQTRHPHRSNIKDHLRGAEGLRVLEPDPQDDSRASLSYESFVAQLQPVLAASRDHKLTEPAGKRVIVPRTAVPMRRHPSAQENDKDKPASPAPRGAGVVREVKPQKRQDQQGG